MGCGTIGQRREFFCGKICGIFKLMLSKKALLNLLPLILIILFASILRLWMLGNVPISLSDDEIREAYTSYSIAHSAKDTNGTFLPIVFKMDVANTFGQIPIYIGSLFFVFLDLNTFTARLPYALSSILSVALIYLIVKKLFNDKIALLASFVASVSVWSIQLARFAIETDITIFLYLLGIFIFLNAKNKTKFIVLSMIVFFLAFYSYSAFKIFFFPLMLILIWYKFKELTKKHLFIIIATIILAFGSFGLLAITQNAASYTGPGASQFFFQDKEKTALNVELERRASNKPNFIKTLYHNKFTYWSRIFTTNYLIAFSPQYLFLDQEASGLYSIWGRGELYIFELPLLIIGFIYLFLKKRKEFYLILLLLLISPLPSALGVGGATWTSRSAFMSVWLYVFIGVGIYALLTLTKDKKYKVLCLILISILYIYAVVGYVSQYYFDWSKTNAKYFSRSTKDLVFFINNSQGKKIIVAGANVNTFLHFAFYNKIDPQLAQEAIKSNLIRFGNVTFTKDCLIDKSKDPLKVISDNEIYIAPLNCKYKTKPSSQIKTYDNVEVVWNIYQK